MSKSSRTAIILTFIGASTYASPWMRNTVMKAGQAGLFDPEAADALRERKMKDSRGNVIPYFREEPAGSPYTYDFTQRWADAGNQPRVDSPVNRPLTDKVTTTEAPAAKENEKAPAAKRDDTDGNGNPLDEDPATTVSKDTAAIESASAADAGKTSTSDTHAAADAKGADTPADSKKTDDDAEANKAKPAATTSQRTRRTPNSK